MVAPGAQFSHFSAFAREYVNEAFCRRLLVKCPGNVPKAAERLKIALTWREQHQELLSKRKFVHAGDYRVIGADRAQRPVLYMCSKNQMLPLAQCLDQMIVCMLQGIDNMPSGVERATHIWDLHGLMVRLNWNPAPLAQAVKSTDCYFAERMHELIIVDLPRVASFLKDAVWPLLTDKFKQKVKFLSVQEVKKHVLREFDDGTASRVVAALDMNRDSSVSLEERRRSWTRVDTLGDVVPAFP